MNQDIHKIALKEWQHRKADLDSMMQSGLQTADPTAFLYNVQVVAQNFVHMSAICRDVTSMSELAAILVKPAALLVVRPDLNWFDASGHYVAQPVPTTMWLNPDGSEAILQTTQFLYMISEMLEFNTSLSANQLTPELKQLNSTYRPLLVSQHLARWGPIFTWINGQLAAAPNPSSDPNNLGVNDKDLMLIATAARALAADASLHSRFLNLGENAMLRNFVKVSVQLVQKRTAHPSLVKSANPSVFGFNLDPGICTVCADSQWAGYTGPVSPALANPPIPVAYVRNVGWDVSHARRFAHYILALEDLAARISLPEYDAKSGAELANQIFYAVFNGDYQQPLFSNFIDGSKGWYRVGYGGPADPGYAPGTLSSSVPFGGYFFLSHDNPKLNTLMRGMADFAMISNSAFRDQYYGPLAPVASYSFGAFQFFPSLIGLQAFPCAFKAIAPNYCSLLP